MMNFRKIILLLNCLWIVLLVDAQESIIVDSLKRAYSNAATATEKVELMDKLSRMMMNVNPGEAEEHGKELIRIAEESRDRELMFRAYLSNGDRCGYFAVQKTYSDKAIRFYTTALELARQNRMEKNVGVAQLRLSGLYLKLPDYEKALSYVTQAFFPDLYTE